MARKSPFRMSCVVLLLTTVIVLVDSFMNGTFPFVVTLYPVVISIFLMINILGDQDLKPSTMVTIGLTINSGLLCGSMVSRMVVP